MLPSLPIEVEDVSSLWVALVGGGSAILGAIIATVAPIIGNWWVRPKLEVVCDAKLDVFDKNWHETTATGIKKIERRYLTVRLGNSGLTTATGVRLYLEKLEKITGDTVVGTPIRGPSFQLAWPGYTFEGLSLPRALTLPAEVVSVDKSLSGWHFMFKTREEHNATSITDYKGIYRFTLTVVADNAKAKKRCLDVSYLGDWQHLKLVKIV